MNREVILDTITSFLSEQSNQVELTPSTWLLESGLVDSLGILELVTHLESTFEIDFSGNDLQAENIASVCSLVESKTRLN